MGCCKCEKYGWGDTPSLPPVYVNPSTNNEYCVFHAPRNRKGIPVAEFNKLVFERIDAVRKVQAQRKRVIINFKSVIFPGDIAYSEYDEGSALVDIDFSRSVFCGEAKFIYTHFSGVVNFSNCVFANKADFSLARYVSGSIGVFQFGGSRFLSTAHFFRAMIKGDAEYNNVVFRKEADFSSATIDGTITFLGTVFIDNAFFHSCVFGCRVRFIDIKPSGYIGFKLATGSNKSVSFIELDALALGRLDFTSAQRECFYFLNCKWPLRLGPDTYGHPNPELLASCEALYRSMKQRAVEEQDQRLASRWHYREKLMAMKRGGEGLFELVMLRLYNFTSGFGELPMKAGGVLAGLVFLPLFIFGSAKLAATGWSTQPDYAAIAEVFTDWQRALPLSKVPTEPLPPVWKLWIVYISQLLIALQAALFGFALRNRFRR